MDKKTFITIVVTVATSVTLTQVVTLLTSFAKDKLTNDVTKTKAKRIFREANILIFCQLCVVGAFVFWLIKAIYQTAPVTRLDIFKIVALVVGIIFSLVMIALMLILEKLTSYMPSSDQSSRRP
jgi:hypothetical protein